MKSLFAQSRKHLRVAWRVEIAIRLMSEGRAIHAVTRNVSAHGLLVFAEEDIAIGSEVQVSIQLNLPGSHAREVEWPIEVRGTVARSDMGAADVVAITFHDLVPEHERALRTAVFGQAMRLMERVSEFPAFRILTELDQLALTSVCHEVHLPQGEHLARLGDEATSLFLVESGRIELRAPYALSGSDPQVEIAYTGQIFGEVSALLDLPHNLDIVAQTDTLLLVIPRDSLHYLRDHNPNLALVLYEIFAAFMGRRLRKLTHRVFSPIGGW